MTTDPEPTVVKLSRPQDVIAAVPVFVGFHPHESLVMMCLHGPRKRNGLTLRADLPDPEYHLDLVADLATRAVTAGADGVLLVCYTEAPDDADGELPHHGLIDRLLAALGEKDVGWGEVLLVRDGRWWSYLCTKACCPREGTPLPDRPSDEVIALEARNAFEGRAVLASREQLAATIRGPVALRAIALAQAYGRAVEAFAREIRAGGIVAAREGTLALARAGLDRYVAGHRDLADEEAARILVGLEDPPTRDHVFTWALDGHRDELVVFLSDLARHALDDDAAAICTLVAGAAYQSGGGALASIALERALNSDPDYALAQILDTALSGQVPPDEIRKLAHRVRSISA